MAENVAITAGSGTTVATDEVTINGALVQVQRVKIALGADNTYSGDLGPGQTTMANSLPVAIASNQTAVPVSVPAGTTTIAKAEDDASANADVGVAILAVRKATPANTSGTDGDYEFLQMSVGRLWTSTVVDTALPAGTNAIGKLAANNGVDIGDVDVTSISAGENHLGEVGGGGTLLDVTLTLDTSAYADGDVFFVAHSLSNAVRVNDGRAILQSVVVLDEDDVGQTFDLVFLDGNNALGTINAAPSISDANARTILGRVRIDSGDYIDLGGMRMASKYGIGLLLKATGGARTLYIGGIIRGAGTYTASGVRLRLGLLWD